MPRGVREHGIRPVGLYAAKARPNPGVQPTLRRTRRIQFRLRSRLARLMRTVGRAGYIVVRL